MWVAEGIYQVQLPLPFPLSVVNAYLLRDEGGWTAVDAGISYPAGWAAWDAAHAALGIGPGDVRRVVLTHAHPDHFGMAGWLAARHGAPVLLSPIEQAFVRATWQAEGAERHAVVDFFRPHGVPEELLAVVDDDLAALREMTLPHPPHLTALRPGEEIRIGGRAFRALHTPGHSDGHLALLCEAERLLLCGDVVLTKITPNIGLWPWGDGDPLGTFLATLGGLAELDVALALPGHGPLIADFAGRVAELRAHHAERLRHAEAAAGAGSSAFEICGRIFATARLTSHQLRFAMAETLAHLERLVREGRLARTEGAPVRFAKPGAPAAPIASIG